MGLSDEERLQKFYFGAMRFRNHLKHLKSVMRRANANTLKIVDGFIDEVDLLVGMVIRSTDSSSAFWFAGMPEGEYAALFHREDDEMAQAGLPVENDRPSWIKEGSLADFASNYDLNWLAEHSLENLNEWDALTCRSLAAWWTAWDEVGNFFYVLNRYNDDLFGEEVKTRFMRLIGRFANTRYRLTGDGWELSDTRKAHRIEKALLGRHQAFKVVLENERKRRGLRADTAPFQRWDFLKAFQKMSLFDLHQVIEKTRQKERKEKYKCQHPDVEKVDTLFGPPMPTRAELETIIETSPDREAVEKAVKQLEVLYSCWIGGWEHRFKPQTKTPKPRKRGKTRS